MNQKTLDEFYDFIDRHKHDEYVFCMDNIDMKALYYKLPEKQQKILDSLCYKNKIEFKAPLTCTPEERVYADFLIKNRIRSNRQWKQTVLERAAEWRQQHPDFYPTEKQRSCLVCRLYKRFVKWLRK